MREISLMTANQEFSKLIREVERGQDYLITRRGLPCPNVERFDGTQRHSR